MTRVSTGLRAEPLRRGLGALSPRAVGLIGTLLALAVVLISGSFAIYERHGRVQAKREQLQLMARVLEDHATRSFETASVALATLADLVARGGDESDAQLGPVLAQTMVGLPVLRGMALLDARGQVLASSNAAEVGLTVDLKRLGAAGPPGRELVAPFVPRRGLAPAVAPPGVGFVPLWRAVATRDGQARTLVALLNPDAVANYQQQVLADDDDLALLATFDGHVLAATANSDVPPGQSLSALPVFSQYLPSTEFGSYVGQGTRGGDQIVAFRASRTRPLVVVVQTSMASALQGWARDLRWFVLATAAVTVVLGLMTFTTARSVRARESARRQRDDAQAEVALRERELSVIVKSVQELLFRTDAAGRLIFVNARWQAASGYPEAQALGHPLADLVLPDSAAAAAALFAHAGPAGVRSARLLLGPAGEVRQFEVAVVPLRAGDAIVGFAGSAMDVTAQHTAQMQLQAQLAFTELLLEVMPLPLATLDPAGRYLAVNQAWEDFTGRHRERVVGERASDLQPLAEARPGEGQDDELLQRGGRIRYDASAIHRDGTRRDLAMTKAAVPGSDGRPAGILVAFMDVTEFRQAERATREARDAAEEASRAKTEFVANISHELRTPLQSIIGFSELGLMRSREQPKLGAMFGDIQAAGQRMLALVNDLLDVAKIESTVGTFHLERTDVRSLVRDVVGELEPLIASRRLRTEIELSEGPLVAKVDPLRFQQVIRNVLANSIRYSPEGAQLLVRGDIDPADHRIHIEVCDRGPGIPPAELEKIFEAFVQSSKTKDGSGGTGLGLAICRKIVEAHGGEIHAENNPDGPGAIFHIRLPARGFADTHTDA